MFKLLTLISYHPNKCQTDLHNKESQNQLMKPIIITKTSLMMIKMMKTTTEFLMIIMILTIKMKTTMITIINKKEKTLKLNQMLRIKRKVTLGKLNLKKQNRQ